MNTNTKNQSICAIVVTYHPDWMILQELLEKLYLQVGKIVIVNNTATTELETQIQACDFHPDILIINPGKNIGLGAAYNTGLNWARSNGSFDYVLLFDQDSSPADNMVSELRHAHQTLSAEGQKVAVVGPNYVDVRTNAPSYTVQLDGCTLKRCYCSDKSKPYIPAMHVISSGSLISISDIEQIGEFDEGLFIDYVDIEWGLRAHSKGYLSFYICPAILYHRLGENLVKLSLPGFRKRQFPFYSPLRCFYTFRNTILLCKKSYIPWGWRCHVLYKCLQRYLFYIVYSSTKLQHIKMMSLGLWQGLLGRTGQYIP
jgi:rhamnosyltransferase